VIPYWLIVFVNKRLSGLGAQDASEAVTAQSAILDEMNMVIINEILKRLLILKKSIFIILRLFPLS
jgi:hypothetical protein